MSDESKTDQSMVDSPKEENGSGVKETSMEQDKDETMTSEGDKSIDKSEDDGDDDKKDDEEEDDEEEEDDDEDDEPQVGLLEKPLVLEEGSKRERKKVERMTFSQSEEPVEAFVIQEGKGRSLGDIPFIEFKLGHTKTEDLKLFYRLLFRKVANTHNCKRHIRQFSGFPFPKDDPEYEKRVQFLKGKTFTLPLLKKILEILDIPRNGTKDDIITRLLEWLEKPTDSGRKVPQAKRKRQSKSGGSKKKKSTGKKGKDKKKPAKKAKKDEDKDDDDEDDNEDDDDDDQNDDNEKKESESEVSDISDDSDDDEETKSPPKKKAKKVTPKPKKKVEPKKKTPNKSAAKKKPTPKKKTKASVEESEDSDSEDEPLAAKKSKSPPTNDELKDVVKKLLDSANLEQVTMKTVLKDVFAKYPEYDLADRKDFIKNTVKQLIS